MGVSIMKKILFGGMMMLAGTISATVLLVGSIVVAELSRLNWRITQPEIMYALEPFWFIRRYQLQIPLAVFVIMAVIGLALSICGLIEKQGK